MDKYVLFVLLMAILSNKTKSQIVQFGECTNVTPMIYFSIDKFLGVWYEIERFPMWYEDYGDCAYKKIQSCGRKIEIETGYVKDGIRFILKVNSTYIPGDDAVFVIDENEIDPIGIPLVIISTDYLNYAVVYGCKYVEDQGIKYISAWILSRGPTLAQDLHEDARMELNALPSSSITYLQQVNQGSQYCEHHWIAHVQASKGNND